MKKTNCPLLEFNNITVLKDHHKKVLDSISLKIYEGENVVILGPNGAGKSSFIKLITREYYPLSEGGESSFKIWGQDRWDVFDLRFLLGIVSNDLQYACAKDITGMEMVLSYPGLAKPSWNPPDWVFGPVWTLLYAMMAIAAWLVWRSRRLQPVRLPLGLYAAQLVLNVLWSALFFAAQSPAQPVARSSCCGWRSQPPSFPFSRVNHAAGILIAPYWAWVSFATFLNFAIWRLN